MAIFSGFYLSHLFCQCLWHMRFSGSPAVYPEVYFTLSTPYSCTLIYQLVFWRVLWNHLSVVPFCQQVRQLTFSMGSAPLSLPSARVALCACSVGSSRPWQHGRGKRKRRDCYLVTLGWAPRRQQNKRNRLLRQRRQAFSGFDSVLWPSHCLVLSLLLNPDKPSSHQAH